MKGIETVAAHMGITTEEFYKMNENHILGIEEAGTGFALSVLMADKYDGQEIGSVQVLSDFGLLLKLDGKENDKSYDYENIISTVLNVVKVYKEQYNGWMKRNIFERQWVLRDFKKTAGHSADQFLEIMQNIEQMVINKKTQEISTYSLEFQKLMEYYKRQYILLQGYEKDPQKLKEYSSTLLQYIEDLKTICDNL
jgi:hypothetical protein